MDTSRIDNMYKDLCSYSMHWIPFTKAQQASFKEQSNEFRPRIQISNMHISLIELIPEQVSTLSMHSTK